MHAGALMERSRVDESYITSCGTWRRGRDADPLVPGGWALFICCASFRFYRGVRIIFYVYLFDCRVVCSVRCFIGVAARGHGSAWRAAAGPGRGGRGPRGARGAGGAFEFCARFSHTSHTRISAECRVACAFSRLSFQFTPVQE